MHNESAHEMSDAQISCTKVLCILWRKLKTPSLPCLAAFKDFNLLVRFVESIHRALLPLLVSWDPEKCHVCDVT